MPRLILASTSPYRRALLERLGLPFETMAPGIDESTFSDRPRTLAMTLARAKARAVADRLEEGLVIGSDQVATLGDEVLGKPGSAVRARHQLERLSGRAHELITAVHVVDAADGRCREHLDVHQITLRTLTEREIAEYVERDSPLDCAGSYKVEGLGIALMDAIRGDDFTAITGLPLIAVRRMLGDLGLRVLG